MAALADVVLVAHAQPGSKTERLAQEVVGWGKQVYTLGHPANERSLYGYSTAFVQGCRQACAVNGMCIVFDLRECVPERCYQHFYGV